MPRVWTRSRARFSWSSQLRPGTWEFRAPRDGLSCSASTDGFGDFRWSSVHEAPEREFNVLRCLPANNQIDGFPQNSRSIDLISTTRMQGPGSFPLLKESTVSCSGHICHSPGESKGPTHELLRNMELCMRLSILRKVELLPNPT